MIRNYKLIILLLALFLTATSGTALLGQDKALKEFRKAFRPAKDAAEAQERRSKALHGISGTDSVAAAEALMDAHGQLEKEILPIVELRRDYLAGKRKDKALRERTGLDPLRELEDRIRDALVALQNPAAVAPMVERALSDRKMAVSLRLALADRAGSAGGPCLKQVLAALKRGKDPEAIVVGLIAARSLGVVAQSVGDRVIALLEHEDPAVRETAAGALATICLPASIEPLVNRLEVETWRTRDRISEALQVLTRQKFGTSVHAWRRWLDGEGKAFVRGKAELGGGKVSSKTSSDLPSYHAIPMDGRSILYVFDRSKSMRRTLTKPSRAAEPGEESRMSRAKDELLRALGNLSPAKEFNVIAFAMSCKTFASEMVAVKPDYIRDAREWVRDLDFEFGTQLYDAMDLAFVTAGRGVENRYYSSQVDTIFVLTDGQPYISNRPDSFKRILPAVARWNLLDRVVIHVIGLGDDIPKRRLLKFAQENGGKFVHEESRGEK